MKSISLKLVNKLLKFYNYKVDYGNFIEPALIDKNFLKIFKMQENFGWSFNGPKIFRLFKIYELLIFSNKVEGDIIEFGCYKGSSALIILETLKTLNSSKNLFLYDSFDGLSDISDKDKKDNYSSYYKKGDFQSSLSTLNKNLEKYDKKYTVLKGTLPNDTNIIPKSKYSFIHIDLDIYLPTKTSIQETFDQLNPGGIVLFDDYGCNETPGAKIAIDEFVKEKKLSLITLSYGQAFLQKI